MKRNLVDRQREMRERMQQGVRRRVSRHPAEQPPNPLTPQTQREKDIESLLGKADQLERMFLETFSTENNRSAMRSMLSEIAGVEDCCRLFHRREFGGEKEVAHADQT